MFDDPDPMTEPSGSLVPPTTPPPGAEAAGTPEPERPKPESGGLRAKVPRQVATVVDRALDVADEVADELKKVIDRVR
jgi:hypothetical protein